MQVKTTMRDFPGSPVVKTLASNVRGASLILGQGTNFHMPPRQKAKTLKKKKKPTYFSIKTSKSVCVKKKKFKNLNEIPLHIL